MLQTNGPVEVEQAFDAEVVQQLVGGVVQANDAVVEDIMQVRVTEVERVKIFGQSKDRESQLLDDTLLGLLSFSRHIKQHDFKGSKLSVAF